MKCLWLSEQHAETVIQYSLASMPNEACGLLVGDAHRVWRIIPIRNVSDDPARRYVMDQTELASHLPSISAEGYHVIGFYHSHPHGDPILSEIDRQESLWKNRLYLVVGLKYGHPRLAAWKICGHRVISVGVRIGQQPSFVEHGAVSSRQKVAIIVGSLIALIVILSLSFELLPSAPPIP